MTTAPDLAEITPPTDPAAYARRRSGGLGFGFWAMILLCLACIAGGVFLSRYLPSGWLGRPTAESAAPAAAVLAAAPDPLPSGPPPRLAGEVVPIPPASSADLTALQARVEALEASQTRTVNAAAAALASASLAEATRGSGSFEAELTALERVLPASAEVRALRPFAEAGAPSRAALAAEFNAAAAKAAVAARDPGDRGDFLGRIGFALSSIVTIRRVGASTGDGPDALLARAGDSVAGGDVEGALRILRGLPPQAAHAMAPWRARAQQRIAVDRQVAAVRAIALTDLMAVTRGAS